MTPAKSLKEAMREAAESFNLDPTMILDRYLNDKVSLLEIMQDIIRDRSAELEKSRQEHSEIVPGMLAWEDPIPDPILDAAISIRDRLGEEIVGFVTEKPAGQPLYPRE